jgi:hypothetical protein
MSWMWTRGAVGVMVVMHDGLVSTLGDGASGRQLNWRFDGGFVGWFATWCGRVRAVGILRLLLGGWLGGIRRGLQLLVTTVSSLSLSLVVRIWNGLLLRVWR